jgi:hypothetical protein
LLGRLLSPQNLALIGIITTTVFVKERLKVGSRGFESLTAHQDYFSLQSESSKTVQLAGKLTEGRLWGGGLASRRAALARHGVRNF